MPDLILAFDSSERELRLCVCSLSNPALSVSSAGKGTESFYSLLEEALQSLSAGFEDISLLVCNSGPGSFVGLRAGLSTAYGFRLARGLKTLPVSAGYARVWAACSDLSDDFSARQETVSKQSLPPKNFRLYQPANRNENFYSRFSLSGQSRGSTSLSQVWSLTQDEPWTTVSKDLLPAKEELQCEVLDVEQYSQFQPQSAVALARLAIAYKRGDLLLTPAPSELSPEHAVEPVYVKPVNALSLEERRLRAAF